MENFMDGKWHDWEGGECPVPKGTKVQAILRAEVGWGGETHPAEDWDWNHDQWDDEADIIQFRVQNRMTLVVVYPTKKALKAAVGQRLHYMDTSMFGAEYKADGKLTVCNCPHITGQGRVFFAEVTMRDHVIQRVT